jgi:hypothetical protein
MPTSEVFKVVRHAAYKVDLLSSVVINNRFVLDYERGKWATPRIGKILVFDSPDSALIFMDRMERTAGLELWRAEADGLAQAPKWLLSAGALAESTKWVAAFWNGQMNPKYGDSYMFQPRPEGTLACDRLKLIEPMSWNMIEDWRARHAAVIN